MMDVLERALSTDADPADIRDGVGVTRVGPLVVVTLARPEQHNALNLAAWRRIGGIFTGLAGEKAVRCVIVRGSGERAFGAGADIREFPEVRMSAESALGYNEAIGAALRAVMSAPQPVLAMIAGLAVGGGCELASACDVRIASSDARFGIPIGRLGVTLGYTEAEALSRLIGPSALKYLLFSGDLIDATEALRIGLVERVHPRDQLVEATVGLVTRMLSSSAVTLEAAKAVASMCGRPIGPADTEQLTRFAVEAYGGPDLKEGVAAFLDGRAPQFAKEGNRIHGSA